jgi:hypothetical protein
MQFTVLGRGVKEARLRAVVLNADGTVKRDLGTIAYGSRNVFKRILWSIGKWLRS